MHTDGSMRHRPLLIAGILRHAEAQFGAQEVVSRETPGPIHRQNFATLARRARQWANGLRRLGLEAGDTVASIAWNNRRHLESYYAVSGSGMVMHTCNPRLAPEQLAYIINHARDRVVLFDATFAPLLCHEELVAGQSDDFEWHELDENTGAVLCYTSGTTGHPKGVLYSHRAIVLNALTACLPGVLHLSVEETVLPVVPMFHINAWYVPYAALIAGAKLVLPGPRLDAPGLYALMETEQVTMNAGVPTIWMTQVQHVEANGLRFSSLKRGCTGGSAMPPALIARLADGLGVEMRHGWGMTETTAVATMSNLSRAERALPAAARHALVGRQGKTVFGIEIKVVDADGTMQIRDRTKDVIKSGGEWISSIELENVAIAHPAVAMAAVIGVKHPKWDERPLLLVVPRPGQNPDPDKVRADHGSTPVPRVLARAHVHANRRAITPRNHTLPGSSRKRLCQWILMIVGGSLKGSSRLTKCPCRLKSSASWPGMTARNSPDSTSGGSIR